MSNKVRLVVEFTSKEEMHAWVHEARAEGLLPQEGRAVEADALDVRGRRAAKGDYILRRVDATGQRVL